jgi:hypothetical protein
VTALHPEHHGGYVVGCTECADDHLMHSSWYDVAERFADAHEDARGHHTTITEVVPGDPV